MDAQGIDPELPAMMRFLAYELEERLGRGGSAEVWRARADDGGAVAVKLFLADVDAGIERLCAGEADRLALIQHPRILRFLGAGRLPHAVGDFSADTAFIVTEFVSGPTLRRVRPQNWAWVEAVTLALLDALAAAHARNVVHLDVKPTNVLLRSVDPPDAVLADFGIAHHFRYDTNPSSKRPYIGTPQYMAPEQIQAYVADFGPWTDLYSVGCIVYELCTGERPFSGTEAEVLRMHVGEAPPPLGSTRFAVPNGLNEWLGRCLVKDTGERFARAADAAWALVQVCRGFDVATDTPPALELDELLVPDSATITWVGADLRTLGGPPPPTNAPELAVYPMAALPASWSRGQNLRDGPLAAFNDDFETLDAVWAEIHGAFRDNEARGVVLVGGEAPRRAALLHALITRVFEFGVGTHVYLRNGDARGPADRVMLQLFRADHFTSAEAAALHCDKLFDAIGRDRLRDADTHALTDWVVEFVDGQVSLDEAERERLAVEFLRAVPRTPLVLIEGLDRARVAFANALLADGRLSGTGAVVVASVDREPEASNGLTKAVSLSLDRP